jgi:hypothetical protein
MYRLIKPENGVFLKAFIILIIQFAFVNLYYSEIGETSLLVIYLLFGALSIFVNTHSAEINPAQLYFQYPIKTKKRVIYDIYAVYYMTIMVFAIFAVLVLILNIVLMLTGFEYESFNPTYNSGNIYKIIVYILYAFMVVFSIQPLKYIVDKVKWYIFLSLSSIAFLIYNITLGSILIGKLTFRTNISEEIKVYDQPGLILAFITIVTVTVVLFSLRVSIKLAKKNRL